MRLIVFIIISCHLVFESYAQSLTLSPTLADSVIAWRRHLHQYPELGNREFATSAFVSERLTRMGIEHKKGVAKTGIIGFVKGLKPGPLLALRADMDALPVTERNALPFASKATTVFNGQSTGVMHACGHDAHTAILLGTAQWLVANKDKFSGTVMLIFQPAEEGAPDGEEGGAALMLKEGLFAENRPEAIFGLHINSSTPVGQIRYKQGSFMAATESFKIQISGKGSHGSQPWLGIDPVVVASHVVQALQTVVSRRSDLVKSPVVVTVGAIHAGNRFNIIPETAEMIGTIRTLDKDVRLQVLAHVQQTAEQVAAALGAKASVDIKNFTLVTYNDSALVTRMLPSLQKAAGPGMVQTMNWVTGGEDFSFFAHEVPGFFFYLGGMPAGTEAGKAAPHHTPDFMIDDSRLDVGVKAFCQMVMDYSRQKQQK